MINITIGDLYNHIKNMPEYTNVIGVGKSNNKTFFICTIKKDTREYIPNYINIFNLANDSKKLFKRGSHE